MTNAATMPHASDPVQPPPSRLIFVRQQFSMHGGGERILDRTIAALHARELPVALLGRRWSGGHAVDFIQCDPPRFPRFSRERRFARAAALLLESERDALIQSHERMPGCDIFRAGDGLHAAYLDRRADGMSSVAALALRLHPYHQSIVHLERDMFAHPRLKAVIVNSSMVAEEIVARFSFPRERIHLVPNGIDLQFFRPEARAVHREAVRARLGADSARPVLLFVGSGYQRKGLDIVIRALAAGGIGAELWVIGSDRDPQAYARIAARAGLPESRLRLLGPVADPLPYYGAADALVLPSIYDPFPSAVLEALACGLPVVTSTGSGARDLIARLDARLVCHPRDPSGLSEAVRVALDLGERPRKSDRSRALAEEFGIDAMIERLLSLYRSLGLSLARA